MNLRRDVLRTRRLAARRRRLPAPCSVTVVRLGIPASVAAEMRDRPPAAAAV